MIEITVHCPFCFSTNIEFIEDIGIKKDNGEYLSIEEYLCHNDDCPKDSPNFFVEA